MSYTFEKVKSDIREIKPNISDKSLNTYVRDLFNTHKKYLIAKGEDWLPYAMKDSMRGELGRLKDLEMFKNGVADIEPLLSKLATSSKRNIYTALFTFLKSQENKQGQKDLNKLLDKGSILDIISDFGREASKYNLEQSKKYEANIVSDKTQKKIEVETPKLFNLITELNKNKNYYDALMLALITKYLFRNEIAILQTIKKADYDLLGKTNKELFEYWKPLYEEARDKERILGDKGGDTYSIHNLSEEELGELKEYYQDKVDKGKGEEIEKDLSGNYIVLENEKPIFISRGTYKTSKKYGVIKTKLNDKFINKLIMNHYNTNMDDNIVFKDAAGKQTNEKNVSKRIGRITEKALGVPLGTSSINKLIIEELNKQPQALSKLKKVGADRGTSVDTLLLAYFNNVKK